MSRGVGEHDVAGERERESERAPRGAHAAAKEPPLGPPPRTAAFLLRKHGSTKPASPARVLSTSIFHSTSTCAPRHRPTSCMSRKAKNAGRLDTPSRVAIS
jgi:hypothetical protein